MDTKTTKDTKRRHPVGALGTRGKARFARDVPGRGLGRRVDPFVSFVSFVVFVSHGAAQPPQAPSLAASGERRRVWWDVSGVGRGFFSAALHPIMGAAATRG